MKFKNIFILLALIFALSGCGKNNGSAQNPDLFNFETGKLIKAENGGIYYLSEVNKRYFFPNDGTYKSWFGEFSNIKVMNYDDLGKIPLGGNATYKPGSRLLQTPTDPHIYFVDLNRTLRPLENEDVAKKIYGSKWKDYVDEIENYYFTNYSIGETLTKDNIPEISKDITLDQVLF